MKKVLVACEESQAVTIELRKLGIEAYSCDTQECSGGHPEWHLKQDVIPLLQNDWDMIIAFPPCTHLSLAGVRWFSEKIKDGRQQQGVDFFMQFVNCKCRRVAIENPRGIMGRVYRKPDQVIQPYQFGDEFQKATCLWLKGLPKLKHTNIVDKGEIGERIKETEINTLFGKLKVKRIKKEARWYTHTKISQTFWNLPNEKRTCLRSKTFPGIAKAMATQWGSILDDKILELF